MSAAQPRHVGVFGGAFDPPHRIHVALAQAAIEQLGLDLLHVVPTGTAWHKQRTLSAAEHRLAMCQLAFAGIDKVRVDPRELQRDGPTYTIDTLLALEQIYPQAQFYLVIGEDQAQAMHNWHRIAEIRRAAIICVAIRAVPAGASGQYGDLLQILPDCRILQMPVSAVSATEIRHKAALGHSVTPLVFEPVARYIDQHHLYQKA